MASVVTNPRSALSNLGFVTTDATFLGRDLRNEQWLPRLKPLINTAGGPRATHSSAEVVQSLGVPLDEVSPRLIPASRMWNRAVYADFRLICT